MRRVVVVGLVLVGCYAPATPGGVPCGPGHACPEGQRCVTSAGVQVCLPEAQPLDDAQQLVIDSALADATLHPPDGAGPDSGHAVCSFSGLTCSGGIGSIVCNNVCFVTCTEGVTEPEAETRCSAWGGHLASILSQADEDCLGNAHPAAVWIGYVQAANQASVSAGWNWVAGQPVTYTNWGTGQPDDGDAVENGAEQCAYKSTMGVWEDEVCTAPTGFACR